MREGGGEREGEEVPHTFTFGLWYQGSVNSDKVHQRPHLLQFHELHIESGSYFSRHQGVVAHSLKRKEGNERNEKTGKRREKREKKKGDKKNERRKRDQEPRWRYLITIKAFCI